MTRVLDLPQSTEIDERPDKKFRGFNGDLCCSREGQQEQTAGSSLICSLRAASLFLMWGEGGGVSRGLARGAT